MVQILTHSQALIYNTKNKHVFKKHFFPFPSQIFHNVQIGNEKPSAKVRILDSLLGGPALHMGWKSTYGKEKPFTKCSPRDHQRIVLSDIGTHM